MDLIINQVMQLQVVHVSDRSRTIEVFTCTSVAELYFTGTADRNAFPESTMVKVLAEVFHRIRTKDILILLLECIPFHIYIIICKLQCILDIILVRAIEYRCGNVKAECLCSKA